MDRQAAANTERPLIRIRQPRVVAKGVEPSLERARIESGLMTGSRARRSAAGNSGIRAYIITTPEMNHTTNSTPSPMPSQRCV